MENIRKIIFTGLAVWIIPFVVSLFFYGPDGKTNLDEMFVKSILLVISLFTGCYFLVGLMNIKRKDTEFFKYGVTIGIVWLVINWGLDELILIPLSGMGQGAYFQKIGLRYMGFLIVAGAMGKILDFYKEQPLSRDSNRMH